MRWWNGYQDTIQVWREFRLVGTNDSILISITDKFDTIQIFDKRMYWEGALVQLRSFDRFDVCILKN